MTTSPTKGGGLLGAWFRSWNRAPWGNPGALRPKPPNTDLASIDQTLGNVEKTLDMIDRVLAENAKLQAANEDLRQQLSNAKANERKLSWRIEAFRKKWPAIHKDFFTAKGKHNEL